jgi:hypothetical protein
MTPFRYGEVTSVARDALLTAFAANNAFIVLPILVEHSKALIDKYGLHSADTDTAADVLVPILFNFPNAGKLLTLLFVPFAAWLAGVPFTSGNYAALFAAGVPSYFAKAQVALPFLMDLFGLPHDLFQLYIPTTILSGKFDSMVTANLLVFALLGAAAMGRFLVLRADGSCARPSGSRWAPLPPSSGWRWCCACRSTRRITATLRLSACTRRGPRRARSCTATGRPSARRLTRPAPRRWHASGRVASCAWDSTPATRRSASGPTARSWASISSCTRSPTSSA